MLLHESRMSCCCASWSTTLTESIGNGSYFLGILNLFLPFLLSFSLRTVNRNRVLWILRVHGHLMRIVGAKSRCTASSRLLNSIITWSILARLLSIFTGLFLYVLEVSGILVILTYSAIGSSTFFRGCSPARKITWDSLTRQKWSSFLLNLLGILIILFFLLYHANILLPDDCAHLF